MNRIPDAGRVAAAFHQKATEYDHHILVQKRVVTNLAASIDIHPGQSPERILDVGTGTGALLEKLHLLYPDAGLTGVDIALNMCLCSQQKLGAICQSVNGDAEHLPFRAGVFDLVVSASALQWVGSLSAALHEMRRVVRPGGDICFAFFCNGTLDELHHCFRDVTGKSVAGGAQSSRLHAFRTVEEVRSIVREMDFERCVVTVETEVDWYADLHSLLRSIKSIGAGTVSGGSVSGLGWRGVLQETSRLYQERYGQDGLIPATYKVLYLSARAGLRPSV
ncbi:MAG: methyltransferase domain-containing protein [Desulfuromonadaceae bacterium]|nr:methyltransferase domain-containing protein [Desulfuromonadaceae bacterium]MDD2849701.1 methyltransferase domain-containing protein [Desulfuromonadaceae bacterium]MDD4129804.1 methyltransferase domain-containing protein [Desulfuromonadaceae bacterium]